jgi:hypothetical protein
VYWCLCSWSPKFRGGTVMIGCDNQAMVAWLNNGCTRSPLENSFLRKIFWLRAKFDFHLVASWIPTEANTMADAISGIDFARFLSCSGIPLSGLSGNLSPTTAVIGKCCSLTTAVVPLSRLSPLHHITYANSSEFRNLLKWLRTNSLPKQETSYVGRAKPNKNLPCSHSRTLHGSCISGHLRIHGRNPFLLCCLGYFD